MKRTAIRFRTLPTLTLTLFSAASAFAAGRRQRGEAVADAGRGRQRPSAPAARPFKDLVQLGERDGDACSNLVVEGCFVYSTLDTAAWSAKDWTEKPACGIWLGRGGHSHVARNNFVLNTRFGKIHPAANRPRL